MKKNWFLGLLMFLGLACPLDGQSRPVISRLSSNATLLTARAKWSPITHKVPVPYQVIWKRNGEVIETDTTTTAVDTVTFSRAGLGLRDTAQVCISVIYQSATYGTLCASAVFTNGTPLPSPIPVALRILPRPVALDSAVAQLFTALMTWNDGTVTTPSVTWAAVCGNLSGVTTSTATYTPTGLCTPGRIIGTASGGLKDTVSMTITSPTPVVPLQAIATVECVYLDCVLDGTASTGNILKYEWWSLCNGCGDQINFTGAIWEYKSPNPTIRTRVLRVTDASSGAISEDTVTFTPTAPPEPPDTLPEPPTPDPVTAVATANCTFLACTLDGSGSSGAVSWAWNPLGYAATHFGEVVTINFFASAAGVQQTWVLTTAEASGATALDTVLFTPSAPPPPPPPPPPVVSTLPAPPALTVTTTYPTITSTINVPVGGNLQTAINRAT